MTSPQIVPFPDSDAFRQRLQLCADKLGNISQLAKVTGLAQSTIRHYFDRGEPNRHNLVTIARAAEVTVDWLASGAGTPPSVSSVSKEDQEEEESFQDRFDRILIKHGGIEGLSSITKIHSDRLAHVKAGGELTRAETRALVHATKVSYDWLLGGLQGSVAPSVPTQDLNKTAFDALMESEDMAAEVRGFAVNHPSPSTWQIHPIDRINAVRRILELLPQVPVIAFKMKDDSMDPTIHKGDLLILAASSSLKEPGIYLIEDTVWESLTIARLAINAGKVICSRDNPKYNNLGSYEYDNSTSKCHGRVICRITNV